MSPDECWPARSVQGRIETAKRRLADRRHTSGAEGEVIHLHRSWTGEEIYSLQIDRSADGTGELAEVRVNDEYPNDDDAIWTLNLLFDKILPQYYGD